MGMKAKTIRLVLNKKIEEWMGTIKDEELKAALKNNIVVAGGCITSMLLDEKPNDYDIYFKTLELAERVAKYYVKVFLAKKAEKDTGQRKIQAIPEVLRVKKKNILGVEEERVVIRIKSAGVAAEESSEYKYFESQPDEETHEFMESTVVPGEEIAEAEKIMEEIKTNKDDKFRPVFMTDNAITLSHRMQLILRFIGEPSEIIKNYDFVHTNCYYNPGGDGLVLPPEALEAILSKSLIYNGSLYPVASILRLRKFIARGWRINAGQVMKIIFQLTKLDLSDKGILYDQLIGVDVAYMIQFIHELDKAKNDGKRLDDLYLAEIIDRVFE